MALRVVLAAVVLGLSLAGVAGAAEAEKPKATPAIDFRKLKELLPDTLGGIKRTEHTGQRTKLGEVSISNAEARYRKPGKDEEDETPQPEIHVVITDFGANSELGAGLAFIELADVDQEDDNGYEKTLKVAGFPAIERWDKNNKSGNIQIYVAKRYSVNVTVEEMTAADTKKIAEALPLKKLAELKE